MNEKRYTPLFKLAELVVGRQAETETIVKGLEFICTQFSFDWAAVYEIELDATFLRKEYCFFRGIPCEDFKLTDPQTHILDLQKNTVLHLDRSKKLCSSAIDFLKKIHSNASSTVSLYYPNGTRFGLVIFSKMDCESYFSDKEKVELDEILELFGRYAAARRGNNNTSLFESGLKIVLDNANIDIYVNDFYTHDILYVNRSMAEPYGGVEAFANKKCWKVLFPGENGKCEFCPEKHLIDDNGRPTKTYTWDYQRAFDGAWFRVFSSAMTWVDGRLAHIVSSANITENKQNENLIEYMANYDALTNLPNRRMLIRDCENRIKHSLPKEKGYVLFFDIDGFKSINDTYGHDTGDDFLVSLGKFFSKISLLKDSIYRNGGDEFIAIIGSVGLSKDNIRSMVSFIHKRFEQPWNLKSGDVYCNISVGVGCYPEDGTTPEELIAIADRAMYAVKKSGGGSILFGYELR